MFMYRTAPGRLVRRTWLRPRSTGSLSTGCTIPCTTLSETDVQRLAIETNCGGAQAFLKDLVKKIPILYVIQLLPIAIKALLEASDRVRGRSLAVILVTIKRMARPQALT